MRAAALRAEALPAGPDGQGRQALLAPPQERPRPRASARRPPGAAPGFDADMQGRAQACATAVRGEGTRGAAGANPNEVGGGAPPRGRADHARRGGRGEARQVRYKARQPPTLARRGRRLEPECSVRQPQGREGRGQLADARGRDADRVAVVRRLLPDRDARGNLVDYRHARRHLRTRRRSTPTSSLRARAAALATPSTSTTSCATRDCGTTDRHACMCARVQLCDDFIHTSSA